MAHRSLLDIDRDRAVHADALGRLNAERRAAVRATIDAIVADFAADKTMAEIAAARGMSQSAVRGVLHRAGRTSRGRTAIALSIREAVGQGAPA